MTVKQLIKRLQDYPQEMKVITDRYSDYDEVGSVEEIGAVDKGYYIMTTHPTMSLNSGEKVESYVYIGV